jgi:hypothetical protein
MSTRSLMGVSETKTVKCEIPYPCLSIPTVPITKEIRQNEMRRDKEKGISCSPYSYRNLLDMKEN